MTLPPPLTEAETLADAEVAQIDATEADTLPTSFGVFKPTGHVMVGLPQQDQLDALVTTLQEAGWSATALRQFAPRETAEELQAMVDKAGVLAGFGYEITLLRRYTTLTASGYRWLLVRVVDGDHAASAARLASDCGATLAVHYRSLTVEDLIT